MLKHWILLVKENKIDFLTFRDCEMTCSGLDEVEIVFYEVDRIGQKPKDNLNLNLIVRGIAAGLGFEPSVCT